MYAEKVLSKGRKDMREEDRRIRGESKAVNREIG